MIKIVCLFFILLLSFTSCIVVKHEAEQQINTNLVLSPKPEVPMSDNIIRSKTGDMIAFLPTGWSLIDVKDKVSSDVIAVAVNPEYTLSAVFSHFRTGDKSNTVYQNEGLLGLARLSLAKHERKTSGSVNQIGKYYTVELGKNKFAKYDFSSTNGAIVTRVAVFASVINEFYEFALIPMDFSGNQLPPSDEVDKIFRSIMTSIKF